MLRRSLGALAGLTLTLGALAAAGTASASVTAPRASRTGTAPMIKVHGTPLLGRTSARLMRRHARKPVC